CARWASANFDYW
nr:immunoglobulin heavy chain junction region [Macaca mulatta]MOV48598.1 immunoglobulin heavy chain junction region [Macaca mulatta]MOV49769.1 immunoglobulin heavy chain junction region [Macaca mulatta]MOV50399.1 immunoglobulin heavy chain junction region [Macaca mulatta]MOV50530.1 immunoglobulin heavy chain junction region [Macaca mulatta]